jgi:hypothetical protein
MQPQLSGTQLRYLFTPALAREDGVAAAAEAAAWVPLEPREKSEHNPDGVYIHGGCFGSFIVTCSYDLLFFRSEVHRTPEPNFLTCLFLHYIYRLLDVRIAVH